MMFHQKFRLLLFFPAQVGLIVFPMRGVDGIPIQLGKILGQGVFGAGFAAHVSVGKEKRQLSGADFFIGANEVNDILLRHSLNYLPTGSNLEEHGRAGPQVKRNVVAELTTYRFRGRQILSVVDKAGIADADKIRIGLRRNCRHQPVLQDVGQVADVRDTV